MRKITKIILASIIIAVLSLPSGLSIKISGDDGDFLFSRNAQAAKKTRYQKMLEDNKIDPALWSKYLPKITRSEYDKVKQKLISVAPQAKKKTRYQKLLETNQIDPALWQMYLPKISKGDYNKVKKKLKALAKLNSGSIGPDITVGLVAYTESELSDSDFRIKANKDYNIKNKDGGVIATVPAATYTKVKYDSGDDLKVYESVAETIVDKEVSFDAVDGNNTDMVFDINKPGTSYDQYRSRIKLRHYDSDEADADRIWVINTLPMEHYVWGMGEITGTGPEDHNRVMTTSFRTYGYWKLKYGTKYAAQGFKVDATSSSQIYYGYDYEISHPRIKEAAQVTRGKVVMHKGEIAITPYSSYTDGRTRSFKERWGSDDYPWCQSVKDPYGKHPSMSTKELEDAGNHMVGLSAHGSLKLADKDGKYEWGWEKILKYYFHDIDITCVY